MSSMLDRITVNLNADDCHTSAADTRGRQAGDQHKHVVVCGGKPVHGGHDRLRHMAILRAQIHAPQQVPLPQVPLVASPDRRPLRVCCAVQPPGGRHHHRDRRRRAGLLRVRDVEDDGRSLLLLRHRQGDRRPLRADASVEPFPHPVREQHGVP